MSRAAKWLLIVAGLCGLLIALGAWLAAQRNPLRSEARRAWKEKAMAEIAALVADSNRLSGELEQLKEAQAQAKPTDEGFWISGHLLLMRNGDWLAYANNCWKEEPHIYDMFLARGSDGQWYYSTYHFCVKMLVLRVGDQPESLAAFAKAHYLRPFDGRSDECLQKTWPPASR
jgi:hypothetical protein